MSIEKKLQDAQDKHQKLIDTQSKKFDDLILKHQAEQEKVQKEFIEKEIKSSEELKATIEKIIKDADKELAAK